MDGVKGLSKKVFSHEFFPEILARRGITLDGGELGTGDQTRDFGRAD